MTLQSHKLNPLLLPWPTDWDEVFDTPGQNRPLIVEIGFGYGHMLFHLAEQNPDANVIGIEVASKPLETVERRIQRREVHNIRVLYGYGETLLYHLLRPASVQEIHINFPDPWFKSGHAHRRVMKRLTVDAVVSRLVPGGMFYLATDIDAYAEMSHELLADTPGLTNVFDTPWAGQIDNRITTKYERRAVEEGRTNKYFAYRRNDTLAPHVPVIEESPMPNLVFKTTANLEDIMRSFEKTATSFDGDIHVSVMNVFYNERMLLFEVYVKEPTIDQHIGFLVSPRSGHPNEYTLKLASFGHPRPTEGVHRAAVLIEQVMTRSLSDDYESVHRKVRE